MRRNEMKASSNAFVARGKTLNCLISRAHRPSTASASTQGGPHDCAGEGIRWWVAHGLDGGEAKRTCLLDLQIAVRVLGVANHQDEERGHARGEEDESL